jgi:heme-degrading monooxygenase HmoA
VVAVPDAHLLDHRLRDREGMRAEGVRAELDPPRPAGHVVRYAKESPSNSAHAERRRHQRALRAWLVHDVAVILEHALLPVKPGEEAAFETAFAQAKLIIAGMPGFRRLTLSRCIEQPSTYLLLVEWRCLEDHIEGFRSSPQYQEWRQLLHHFYAPFPRVEHYEQVDHA